MNRKPLKQMLAVMLAVSYLWIFAACVLICVESGCADEDSNVYAVSANHETPSHSFCPIMETPKVTTSDRFAFKTPDIKAVVTLHSFDFEPKADYVGLRLVRQDFVFISPPLERLPVIRI